MIRHSVDRVDVDLGGNRSLRASLFRGPDGTASDFILDVGFGMEHGWRGHAATLALPPSAIPGLIAALQQLEAGRG